MLLLLFLCHLAISFARPTVMIREVDPRNVFFSKISDPITRSEIDVNSTTGAASTVDTNSRIMYNLFFNRPPGQPIPNDEVAFMHELGHNKLGSTPQGDFVVRKNVDEWLTPRHAKLVLFPSIFAMAMVYRFCIRWRNSGYTVSGMFRSPHSADKDKLLKDDNSTTSDLVDITI